MKDKVGRHVVYLLGAILGLVFIFVIARPVLPSCLAATLIAYLLNPMVDKLAKTGTPRVVSSFFIVFTSAGMLGALVVFLTPVLYTQALGILKLLMEEVPLIDLDDVRTALNLYVPSPEGGANDSETSSLGLITENLFNLEGKELLQLLRDAYMYFGKVLVGIGRSSVGLGNYIVKIVITFLLSFYILWHWPAIVENTLSLVPRRYLKSFSDFMARVDDIVSSYIRGQMIVCALLACYYCVCFVSVGLEYSLIVGFISGLMTFIPYIGPLLSIILVGCVALYQGLGTAKLIAVVSIFVVGYVLESNIVSPAIIGNKLALSPAWLVIGMVILSSHAGFLGALLSIPITAILGVVVQSAIKLYTRSSFYLGT